MNRIYTSLLISVFIVGLYLASFFVAYKLGLSKDELLKNLISTVPSGLSVIVAVIVALFTNKKQSIGWQVVSTSLDWKTRVNVGIVNLTSTPIFDLSVQLHHSSFRFVKSLPESIPPLERNSFIFEFGPSNTPEKQNDQLRHVVNKKYSLVIGYRDDANDRKKYKKLSVRNPLYIPNARLKIYYQKAKKIWSQLF